MGTYVLGQRNDRGEQLLDLCYADDLYTSTTKFKQAKPSRCWTWESPEKCTNSQVDYILVSRKLLSSNPNSCSFPAVDLGSYLQLVMANVKLKLRKSMPGKTTKRSITNNC